MVLQNLKQPQKQSNTTATTSNIALPATTWQGCRSNQTQQHCETLKLNAAKCRWLALVYNTVDTQLSQIKYLIN